jgi:hypothetical protein
LALGKKTVILLEMAQTALGKAEKSVILLKTVKLELGKAEK